MPRYVIERRFVEGLHIPVDEAGVRACQAVATNNDQERVTWLHSYVSLDKKRSVCVYDGPTPEAVRRAAGRNNLPITSITEVRVLDPYFYK